MHHCNNHNTTRTHSKKNAKRKCSNQTTSHISIDNRIYERIYSDPCRPLFYRSNEPHTEMLLLTVIVFGSSGNLSLRGR